MREESDYQDPDITEILKPQGPGFDHRVEIRHPRTGQLLKLQDYKMTVTESAIGNIRVYERDSKRYWEDGTECTREDLVEVLGENHPLTSAAKPKIEKKRARSGAA